MHLKLQKTQSGKVTMGITHSNDLFDFSRVNIFLASGSCMLSFSLHRHPVECCYVTIKVFETRAAGHVMIFTPLVNCSVLFFQAGAS